MSGRNIKFVFGFQSTCCNGLERDALLKDGLWERKEANWHVAGRSVSRIDTVSGIPPCVDDTDNHCDYHSVYVHLEVDTPAGYWAMALHFWPGINKISIALQLVARNRRQGFISTGCFC